MKNIAIFIDTINAAQHTTVTELLTENKDNNYIGLNLKKTIAHPNLKETKDIQYFLDFCCSAQDLILIGSDEFSIDEKMLNSFFSNSLGNVWHIRSDGCLRRYRLNPNRKASTLLVFPGCILPLTLGSHQRVFNLLVNLGKNGILVDVLITTPKNVKQSEYQTALKTICNNVYIYKNNKKKHSTTVNTKRYLESKARTFLGKSKELPELFSERLNTRPTESCKRWVNSLHLANKYESVIVSYAWMMGALEYIIHDSENFKVICDTHDVQFTRNDDILNRKERIFFNSLAEKKCELDELKKCDSVLAISVSDEDILNKALKKSANTNVIRASSGFDYALSQVKSRPHGKPLFFGFIGGQMSANVKSLVHILDIWWPAIKQYSPDSKLFIAGSICKSAEILPKIFLDTNIVPLGFVNNIGEFYNNIDVSLNPVLVQGGLNFKSVEAVFAGKHLVTNKLGQECLGTEFPSTIVEKPEDIIEFISKYEFNPKKCFGMRVANQNKAKQLFANKKTYLELVNYLAGQHA
ncbi:glycosyltransferase family 4 protein [Pseudomonas sp. P5_152]|uniref:glycosyltransferase n=1 Tax=Pseudomonas sp. P5_152 TaxID=3043442 RepID=UPI002A36E32C|nr:glycosyltransferase family 4 protein [Pseudomonas sp. P5_152]MDX9664232.1 glycosyltransferase family 4 protein [Pseudomonas sp. P5_152]